MESSSNSGGGPGRASAGASDGAMARTVVRDVGLVEHNYEGPQMYCDCGFKAPRWTSWRPWSIGRRFYGCRHFLNEDLKCPYFVWHDLELSHERAIELLKLLITEKKALTTENSVLRRQLRNRVNGGAVVESSHTISTTAEDTIQKFDEIIEKTVANAMNDIVERKFDVLIAASVGVELKKLMVHIVFGVFIIMVVYLMFWVLF
ncbi:hypothetical protein SLEP1_g40152 [Rubroshorea leprosula]|uniref:Zinc finger GRF-type domain-containing protein n=1 Tax=Rubroshorea leprosula TaxID=152421 RepID=A0AAV5L3W3_9ROSI|nr:hypothetical protein SLEP1_g40152 [Rubroshorea leprosula]